VVASALLPLPLAAAWAHAEPQAPVLVRPVAVPCLGYNGLERLNPAAQVAAGLFRSSDGPAERVAKGSNVNWGLDPHHDRTWQLWFHSLEWLGGLIGKGDRASLDLAAGIARDWLNDNARPNRFNRNRREAISQATKFRLITLTCLRTRYSARWLDKAIASHAAWLAKPGNYSGPWNHGTDESMTLLAAGCGIGRADLSGIGYKRLLNAALKGPRPTIDSEGANNEQSTQYAVYNRSRWRLAMEVMRACGYDVPAALSRRHARMDEFIAFQATPAGDLLQIGESYAARLDKISRPGTGPLAYVISEGKTGRRPSSRARVYKAGYVMGRSGWGDHGRRYRDEMAYVARFGPGRYAHGQCDHMEVDFFAQGRDILVPSGHIGYSDKSWQNWLRSPEAHNTLVVRGTTFNAAATTKLAGHTFRRGADTFRFTDTAFAGTARTRTVLAASAPDALVVLDDVGSKSARTVEQLWHLPADFTARGGVATAGDVRTHFIRIPLPNAGTSIPTQVAKGWVVPAARKPRPAPIIRIGGRGTRVRLLTLIAPVLGTSAPKIRTSLRRGVYTVVADFPGHRLTFQVTPNGTLRRLS